MKRFLAPLLVVAVLTAVLVTGRHMLVYVPLGVSWVRGLGAWGPVAFTLLCVVTTVAFIPGAWMALAAGAIFGVARGFAIVFSGAVIGSCAAFLIARHSARGWVAARLRPGAAFDQIDRAVAARGGRIVLLLRLSPLVPFNVLNYMLGLTRVRFIDYLAGAAGMIPMTMVYIYSGKVAGDVAAAAGGATVTRGAAYYTVLVGGLAATLAVSVILARIASRALREATAQR